MLIPVFVSIPNWATTAAIGPGRSPTTTRSSTAGSRLLGASSPSTPGRRSVVGARRARRAARLPPSSTVSSSGRR